MLKANRLIVLGMLGMLGLSLAGQEIGIRYVQLPEGSEYLAVFVNADDGRLVAGQVGRNMADGQPFYWTPETGIQILSIAGDGVSTPENWFGRVQGSSTDGRYLVGRILDAAGHTIAFRYDRETDAYDLMDPPVETTPLPSFPQLRARAIAVSDDGLLVVGQMRVGTQFEAGYWDFRGGAQGAWLSLPVRETDFSGVFPEAATLTPWAYGISGDGRRIMGFVHAFLPIPESISFFSTVGFVWDSENGLRLLGSGGNLLYGFEEQGYPADMSLWGFSRDGSTIVGALSVNQPDGPSGSFPARWDYDTLHPETAAPPAGWSWGLANNASEDGSVIAGYLGRTETDALGNSYPVFEGMLWTAGTGIVNFNDHLHDRFGVVLSGNQVRSLHVSRDGQLLSGTADTAAGPRIIQLWDSPFRVLHAYPPPGYDSMSMIRASADARVFGGFINADAPPGDFTVGRFNQSVVWDEARGYRRLTARFLLDGREYFGSDSFLRAVSADGRFVCGQLNSPFEGALGYRYEVATGEWTLTASPSSLWALSRDGQTGAGRAGAAQAVKWDFTLSPEDPGHMTVIPLAGAVPAGWQLRSAWPRTLAPDGTRVAGSANLAGPDGGQVQMGFTHDAVNGVRWVDHAPAEAPPPEHMLATEPFQFSADGNHLAGYTSWYSLDPQQAHDQAVAVRWSYDSLAAQPLGNLPGFTESRSFSISGDGTVIAGRATRPLDPADPDAPTSGAFLWTEAAGLTDLNAYLANRFGPARAENRLTTAYVAAEGRHLYGTLLWGDQRELIRIALPSVPGSTADQLGAIRRWGEQWVESEWFGRFAETPSDWIYHAEHGYMVPASGAEDGFFLFDDTLDAWIWTTADLYPWFHVHGDSERWIWYVQGGTPDGRWFYYADTNQWVFHTPGS